MQNSLAVCGSADQPTLPHTKAGRDEGQMGCFVFTQIQIHFLWRFCKRNAKSPHFHSKFLPLNQTGKQELGRMETVSIRPKIDPKWSFFSVGGMVSGSSLLVPLWVCVSSLLLPVDGARSRVSAVAKHLQGLPVPPHLHHVSNQQHRSLVGNQRSYLTCSLYQLGRQNSILVLRCPVLRCASVCGVLLLCLCIFALPDSLTTLWRLKVLISKLLLLDSQHPNLNRWRLFRFFLWPGQPFCNTSIIYFFLVGVRGGFQSLTNNSFTPLKPVPLVSRC